ncbi:hypothetical protein SMKI_13G1740 [Saccharomyces mikatae IFO 1815]|uniref:Chromosome segregation in meiosis protein n=1 Tax=Saccharomyces mikatae IFO 1815 TaxID=226126 RepID=A0AA35IU55_SACMI|nr:uncharacterized protein SMKI_13G1740 [Saccharomyces mikatae IFO 1815]CAI4035525.1 hypothetical protein SMKI_13G1740 [Saccharomyces mikatae IFO 1815]
MSEKNKQDFIDVMDEDTNNLLFPLDGSQDVGKDPTIPNGLDASIGDPTIADPTAIVTKRRRPQVKLTAEKLLSDKGLPYILKNAHKRIRISSRKNSYDNLSGIIQFYQLWAHELFPKAKFKDFMKICQTMGKTDPVLREYRVSLFRDEMGMSFEVSTRDGGQGLETQSPMVREHSTDLGMEPVATDGFNKQDKTDVNKNDKDEDDDIYHPSSSNRKKRVSDETRNDSPAEHNSAPPKEDTDTLLKRFRVQGSSGFDENEKKLLLGWLDAHRSIKKDLMTEEDVEMVQKLEEWEMDDIGESETQYDFLPGEDEFSVDQDELDAMKEMGF